GSKLGRITSEGRVFSVSSAASKIEVQWSEAHCYAMMLVSPAKPSKDTSHQQGRDTNTPDQKYSHYRKWQGIDASQTERLKRIPQRWPQEEIQHTYQQKQSE